MEPIDAYSDQFTISVGPYGASLSFLVTAPHPDPSAPKLPEKVATIRMSVEHLKTMTVIIARHVKKAESEMGLSFPVPNQLLAQMGIAPGDWDSFWAKPGMTK